MSYQFPLIKTIKDVDAAIDPECFFVAQKDGYQVINYHHTSPATFPEITDENSKIRREFRGICFDMEGNIIRRPFQKFFNIGEKSETNLETLDVSRPHLILDKLDGSMVSFFMVNNKPIWGTRMGATEVSDQVVEWLKSQPDRNERYESFAKELFYVGYTAIFEWCSNTQRIVIDYPVSNLILTGVRNMVTGEYVDIHNFSI